MSEPVDNHGAADASLRPAPSASGPATLSDRVRSLRLPDQPASKRASTSWLVWLLVLILAGTTTYLGYLVYGYSQAASQLAQDNGSEGSKAGSGKPSLASPGAPLAASGKVALESKGYIIPAHQIQVSPKIGGMIIWLDPRFEEGQRFQEGEVLARLEDVDYRTDRDHAQAVLRTAQERLRELKNGYRLQEKEQARAELEEQAANLKQLQLDLARTQRLSGSSAMAQRDYELAKYAHDAMSGRVAKMRAAYSLILEGTREEQIQQAEANVKQAEADLAKAQWRLDQCQILAPVTGTILTKKAEKGNIVNPIAFNISASLCDMADLADLEVDLSIQERDISKVFAGQRCKVYAEAYRERIYDGVVSRLMPIADRAKGAVPVRVKLSVPKEEEGRYLKPEMGAVVSFLQAEKDPS